MPFISFHIANVVTIYSSDEQLFSCIIIRKNYDYLGMDRYNRDSLFSR